MMQRTLSERQKKEEENQTLRIGSHLDFFLTDERGQSKTKGMIKKTRENSERED